MATEFIQDNEGLHSLEGLTGSENTEAIRSDNGGFLAGAVHVVGGGGTNFNSDTVTIQASLDNVNWFSANDVTGTAMEITADAYYEFCLAARYIRASAGSGIGDVDVAFFLT